MTMIAIPANATPLKRNHPPTRIPMTHQKGAHSISPAITVLHLTQAICSGERVAPQRRQNFLWLFGAAPQDGQTPAPFDTGFPQLVQNIRYLSVKVI